MITFIDNETFGHWFEKWIINTLIEQGAPITKSIGTAMDLEEGTEFVYNVIPNTSSSEISNCRVDITLNVDEKSFYHKIGYSYRLTQHPTTQISSGIRIGNQHNNITLFKTPVLVIDFSTDKHFIDALLEGSQNENRQLKTEIFEITRFCVKAIVSFCETHDLQMMQWKALTETIDVSHKNPKQSKSQEERIQNAKHAFKNADPKKILEIAFRMNKITKEEYEQKLAQMTLRNDKNTDNKLFPNIKAWSKIAETNIQILENVPPKYRVEVAWGVSTETKNTHEWQTAVFGENKKGGKYFTFEDILNSTVVPTQHKDFIKEFLMYGNSSLNKYIPLNRSLDKMGNKIDELEKTTPALKKSKTNSTKSGKGE